MGLFGLFKKKKEVPLPEDSLEVVKLWQTACRENDGPMIFRTAQRLVDDGYAYHWSLGECYLHGRGVPKNQERALYYFDRALEEGSVRDMSRYADLLNDGVYLPQNKKQALYLYRTAAARNEGHACLYLYRLQTDGQLPEPHYTEDELAWMLLNAVLDKQPGAKEAFAQHAKTHRSKADHYQSLADGCVRSETTDNLYEYTKKAASYGSSIGLFNLGLLHYKGIDTYQSEGMSVYYWEGSVELYNDIDAMFALGLAHEERYVWLTNCTENMVHWYTRAAEAGHAEAANNLGVYYRKRNDPKSLKKSFELFTRAAELGSAKAMLNLYTAYWDGIGVSRNFDTARQYHWKAGQTPVSDPMRIRVR